MQIFSRPFLLLQLGYFVFSLAGIFLKKGSQHPFLSFTFLACYAATLFCVFLFALIWQQVLRKYELMVAYAWRGTLFLWTFLWAVLFFGETVTFNNLVGAGIIFSGILLVVRSE